MLIAPHLFVCVLKEIALLVAKIKDGVALLKLKSKWNLSFFLR